MKWMGILGATALCVMAVHGQAGAPAQFADKPGGAPLAPKQEATVLSVAQRTVFVELADDSLRLAPLNLAKPLVSRLLGDLRLNTRIAGRVMNRFWIIQLPDLRTRGDLDSAIQLLRANPAVRSVSENNVYQPSAFNDPGYTNQFAIYTGTNQNNPDSYDSRFVSLIERTTPDSEPIVRVGVLDTGYAPSADLQNQFDVQANFVEGFELDSAQNRYVSDAAAFASAMEPANSGANGSEPFYHGSKVQSLINAIDNNSSGIVGLDRKIAISQVRVLGDEGGNTLDVSMGLVWSVGLYDRFVAESENDPNYTFFPKLPVNTKPANVLNLSLGRLGVCSSFEQAVIDFVMNNSDALVVVAAGNDGRIGSTRVPGAPANCNGTVSVGASTTRFGSTFYSNVSPQLVTSTLGGDSLVSDFLPVTEPSVLRSSNGVAFAQGTSFSTPLVSGVLATALKLGIKQGLSRADVVNSLQTTGFDYKDSNEYCGRNTDPATGMRPCGTILNTAGFIFAVTGKELVDQGTPPTTPPGGGTPVPPPDTTAPEQPGTDEGGAPPNQPTDPNPVETKSVQFAGTVKNVDASSIRFVAASSAVDAASYSVSFDPATETFVINVSIPGQYSLEFEADRAGDAAAVQPAVAGQTRFLSNVVLDGDTRVVTASDPMPQSAAQQPTENNVAPAGGGGGGGALNLFGLLAMLGLLLALQRKGIEFDR